MQWLHRRGKIKCHALDYGSGRGDDADRLSMDKFDPHYTKGLIVEPNGQTVFHKYYDVITCNYVLNVIPSVSDRLNVLADIQSMLLDDSSRAYIAIRRDIKKEGYTSNGTYQENVTLNLPVVVERKNQFIIYALSKQDIIG